MKDWHILNINYLFKHPYISAKVENRFSPKLGEHSYFLLEFPDWANIAAITQSGDFILIRQYRHGMGIVNLEIPGGVVDKGEEPGAAALRELVEETGYVPDSIRLLRRVSVNPAIQDNWCHLYLATGCKILATQNLDSSEDISVALVSRSEVKELLRAGEIHHSLNVLALTLALQETE